MRRSNVWTALAACVVATPALASGVVYVTDLSIFTYLAPCAASALSENIQEQTESACPAAVTALQSCVCSKNQNFASISSAIVNSVSAGCSSTASQDQSSAQAVFSAYCNQDSAVTFATPTNPVTQYPTDIVALSELAPCASSNLVEAIMTLTYDLCPPDPSDLATCACSKNQNSLKVSQYINTYVKEGCSSHTADISSAQAMFAAYCAMNDGTTSFPTASDPPGEMTYYISALPAYSSLAPCAQSALYYAVNSMTYDACPTGPKALASCACIKSSISGSLTSIISTGVTWSCESTATEDVASALSVFDFYCSAARGQVTPTGISESVAQNYPSGVGTGAGGSGGGGSTGTGSGGKSTGGATSGSGNGTSAVTSNVPVIAGAVGGVVGGLALIGVGLFFLMRSIRKKKQQNAQGPMMETSAMNMPPQPPNYHGTPELASAMAGPFPPPSPSPSMMKQGASPRTDTVSPISSGSPYPAPDRPELQGQSGYPPLPNRSELQGQYSSQLTIPDQVYGHPPHPQATQAYGQQVHEFPSQGAAIYQANSRPVQRPAELSGMGYQSGPFAQSYHELDGGQQPHAR